MWSEHLPPYSSGPKAVFQVRAKCNQWSVRNEGKPQSRGKGHSQGGRCPWVTAAATFIPPPLVPFAPLPPLPAPPPPPPPSSFFPNVSWINLKLFIFWAGITHCTMNSNCKPFPSSWVTKIRHGYPANFFSNLTSRRGVGKESCQRIDHLRNSHLH